MCPMDIVYPLPDLPAVAAQLAERYGHLPVWTFTGDLGAGKTTLIQALCRHWGVQADVSSPTFALINVYPAANGATVVHADLYRLRSADEADNIGLTDYLYPPAGSPPVRCLIEWPEVAEALLPPGQTLHLALDILPDGRRTLSANPDGAY